MTMPADAGHAREPLERATVTRYAAGALPLAVLGLPLTVYLPPYITEGGTIAVGLVGLLFTLTIIWDGVVDPLIGTIIDRGEKGPRAYRRWMWRASFPLLLCLILLLSIGDRLPFLILLPLMLVFYSSFSLYDVAQLAWGSSLAHNPDDSSRLFGARDWAAKLVLIAAFGAPALAQALIPGLSLQGRIIAYASLVAIALPVALWCAHRLVAAPATVPDIAPVTGDSANWRAELGSILRFPAFLWLLAVQTATSFAFSSLTALFIYFADGVLRLDSQSSLLLFATFIGGAVTTPLWTALARRISKRRAMMAMAAMLSALILLAFVVPPGMLLVAVGFSALLGSGFVGLIFIYGMAADLVPVDRARSGRDRTGLLFALINVMQKIGTALAVGLSYVALQIAGFAPGNVAASAGAIETLFVLMPLAGWLLVIALLVPLGREPALASTGHIR